MSTELDTPRSMELYERALAVMPGGSSRLTVFMQPHPFYAVRGEGSRVWDADGRERVDFLNNFMTLIHGHNHPEIVEAVVDQAQRGLSFAMPTEQEILLAETLCGRVPSFEQIRFCNSGSEAVMVAIKAARAHTGRPMIAKCEGAYHGSYDPVEVSHEATPDSWGNEAAPARTPYVVGTPASVLADTLVIPFNDTEHTQALIEAHADRLAAVIVDPVPPRIGYLPADPSYLRMLREITRAHGIVLIFDEVASFRLGYRGAQGDAGIDPDLTTLGKIIGGGLPVGAVAGSRAVMAVFDPRHGKPPFQHGGTFNANPMTMAAGHAAMRLWTEEKVTELNARGDRLRGEVTRMLNEIGFDGQITGAGSLARLHMSGRAMRGFRDVYTRPDEKPWYAKLHRAMLDRGFLMGATGIVVLSTANTEDEVDGFVAALRASLVGLKRNRYAAA